MLLILPFEIGSFEMKLWFINSIFKTSAISGFLHRFRDSVLESTTLNEPGILILPKPVGTPPSSRKYYIVVQQGCCCCYHYHRLTSIGEGLKKCGKA